MSRTSDKIVKALLENEEEDYKGLYNVPERPWYLPLGTVSHGTMREEHLIPRFLDALDTVDHDRAEFLRSRYCFVDADDPEFCWDTVFNSLNDHAPPFTYFGAHPGDGSDYGVWVNDEAIASVLAEGDNELGEMVEGGTIPTGYKYVVVKDRAGDYVELLDGQTGKQIWRT